MWYKSISFSSYSRSESCRDFYPDSGPLKEKEQEGIELEQPSISLVFVFDKHCNLFKAHGREKKYGNVKSQQIVLYLQMN